MYYQTQNSVGQRYFECIRYVDFFFVAHMHRHPELILVESGEVVVTTDGGDETVRAGECALILPNRIHSYRTPTASVSYAVIFSEDHVPHFVKEVRSRRANSARFLPDEAAWRFALATLTREEHPGEYAIKAALYALLGAYLDQTRFSTFPGSDTRLLDRIVTYVSENHTENLTLTSMAKDLGYEEHYLSRYFHSHIPMHFSRFVNWYRVNSASELLSNTTLPVTEIALRCGFQSIRSFNRVFKELTGKTPSGR
ncbi:MAG: AraC family transcriptional regulator [Clostridia bacterium]|nr:AraC family transcriptional regulator [Clostridia bacterium]